MFCKLLWIRQKNNAITGLEKNENKEIWHQCHIFFIYISWSRLILQRWVRFVLERYQVWILNATLAITNCFALLYLVFLNKFWDKMYPEISRNCLLHPHFRPNNIQSFCSTRHYISFAVDTMSLSNMEITVHRIWSIIPWLYSRMSTNRIWL